MGQSDDLANIKTMEETYTKLRCPQDASTTAFTSTSIYWRPRSQREPAAGSSSSEAANDALEVMDIANKLQATTVS